MKISILAQPSLVSVDLRAQTPEMVIREIMGRISRVKRIGTPEEIITKVLERELCSSTGIGNGVAVPHARMEGIDEVLFFAGLSRRGIDFNSPDGKPVNLIFFLVTPFTRSGTHLKTLSRIASLARDEALVRKLKQAGTDDELYSILRAPDIDREGFLVLPEEEICQEIETSESGLSETEAALRLREYGRNELRKTRKTFLLKRFLDNFTNLLAILMWVGSGLAFLIGMVEVGWAIIAVIVINAIFSFWQEFKAERALEALKSLMPSYVSAIRDGETKRIPSEDTVPGDVILFDEGDSITADARLVEAHELRVDNSIFSGESRPGYKTSDPLRDRKDFLWTEIPNMVFAGTSVISGMGRAVVVATGMSTELGKIAYLTETVQVGLSPLQKEINKLTKIIALVAAVMGLFFFLLGNFFAELTFAGAAIFAIGIILGNVPEGLLPTVTLSLAMGVQRMAGRHALIKKLSSVETLGSTNVICTDKTGTLTTNRISVQSVWLNREMYSVTGSDFEPRGQWLHDGQQVNPADQFKGDRAFRLFIDTCIVCTSARLVPPSSERREWSVIGDPTEGALLVLAGKSGFSLEQEQLHCPVSKRFPFESVRKRMSILYGTDSSWRALVKGAPKEVLDISRQIRIGNQVLPLTDEIRDEITSHMDAFARKGLRVLGMAYRDMTDVRALDSLESSDVERDLIFLGLAAMYDPPRPEVRDALASCRRAGIRVVMITGDYGLTAVSIAREVGIVSSADARVITGLELSDLSEDDLREALGGEVVFARVNPEHKLRIVNAFKEQGHIVAVTGDGVNDAPALKRADIGIAMGIRGTDVAKESADMVLTDDNFASIVSAIEEGRAVFDNIKKFITYIFAHLVPEAIPFVLYVLLKVPAPITAMQILAIDLGTETIPALALGVEKPERGIMDRPPRPKTSGLVDRMVLFRGYVFLGLLNSAAVLVAYFLILYNGGWHPGVQLEPNETTFLNPLHLKATTMVFAGIVVMQIANVFACRSETKSVFELGFFDNRLIIWGIIFELAFTAALIYVAPLQGFFNTISIKWQDWAILFGLMIVIFAAEEIRKYFVRR